MLISRMVLLCLIFLLMLVVPLLLWKDWDNKEKAVTAKEVAVAAPPTATAAVPAVASPVANPDRWGLTFGWKAVEQPDALNASCHGEPRDLEHPRSGACNPYEGDTSCRTELPVLCVQPQGSRGLGLATTSAVAGFLLSSHEAADARCVEELGTGWRMGSFHDGGAWEIPGVRVTAVPVAAAQRVWVAIDDQKANCWD